MAAAAAAAARCGCVFDGCISSVDSEIRRRPYHRNCGCALHRSGCLLQDVPCGARVSYRVRCDWSGASLTSSSSSSLAMAAIGGTHLVSYRREEEEEDS